MTDRKGSADHYEMAVEDPIKPVDPPSPENFDGDVNLASSDGVTYLIPAPSADPRGMSLLARTREWETDTDLDPLNLPLYRKLVRANPSLIFPIIRHVLIKDIRYCLGWFALLAVLA